MLSWPKLPFVYVSDYDAEQHLRCKSDTLPTEDITPQLTSVSTEHKIQTLILDDNERKDSTMLSCSDVDVLSSVIDGDIDDKVNELHQGDLNSFYEPEVPTNNFIFSNKSEAEVRDGTFVDQLSETSCMRCLLEGGIEQAWSTDMIAKPVYMGNFNFRQFSKIINFCSIPSFLSEKIDSDLNCYQIPQLFNTSVNEDFKGTDSPYEDKLQKDLNSSIYSDQNNSHQEISSQLTAVDVPKHSPLDVSKIPYGISQCFSEDASDAQGLVHQQASSPYNTVQTTTTTITTTAPELCSVDQCCHSDHHVVTPCPVHELRRS